MMKHKVAIAIIGTVVVGIAALGYFMILANRAEAPRAITNPPKNQTVEQPSQSGSKFAKLTGAEFDEAYIADMLAHHDGAVNMAEQAQAVTAHQEIQKFAGDITAAQSTEIMKMRQWQKDWGYEVTMSGGHMSHGGAGMDMGGDMVEMMNKLKNLTGDAYDQEFLKQMIIHHEQAVEMSQFAETNAEHAEVKQLARDIMASQAAEVRQMKQWQKDWGYEK